MKKLTALLLIGLAACSPAPEEVQQLTLGELKEVSYEDKVSGAEAYRVANKVGIGSDPFYNCASYMASRKAQDLTYEEVLGWCKKLVDGGQDLSDYVNMDMIEGYFSPWDNSHPGLTQLIKLTLNDPDSFEHDSTSYRFISGSGDEKPYLNVITQYRAANGYGGIVRAGVEAKVDASNGELIDIVREW